MRKETLEKMSEKILEYAEHKEENRNIDTIQLAKCSGFRVVEALTLDADEDGFVKTAAESGGIIGVNIDRSIQSKRYIIAHEFACFVLYSSVGKKPFLHRKVAAHRRAREKEAEYLARCILMPRNTFLPAYRKLRQNRSRSRIVSELQEAFCVPKEVAEARIRDLI